ncbi:MAG: hypothetical protein RLZZ419_416 [Pseudomonadota bacterium]
MDIDFHYYATYVAACFAGYPEKDALTIATSAQMIDENSRHVLVKKTGDATGLMGFPDDFKLRYHADGPTIHTYRVQMTFQGLGDIGTSSNDTLSSIWPVYHFLPGNFRVSGKRNSERWFPRTLKASYATDAKLNEKFEWLCRPHSPMAISMINNCRELYHDKTSEIYKHKLTNYLIGVTMHVFADTWGHQDFLGFGVRKINSRGEIEAEKDGFGTSLISRKYDLSYAFINPVTISLPSFIGTAKTYSPESTWKNCDWKECAPKNLGYITDNAAIGHGIVGHLPDHSSLLWTYKPAWSEGQITRLNPVEYYDAFVHLIWAMKCIKENQPYSPIDVTSANISSKLDISKEKLLAVYKLIALERHPWAKGCKKLRVTEDVTIEDTWDGMIYLHGFTWRDLITDVLGLGSIPEWIPGQSKWMKNAYAVLEENKAKKNENWYTVQQFKTLEFFKFNIAAKFHYRFVKQQLLAFNKELLGNWADGAAYADDLGRLSDNAPHQLWLVDIVTKLGDLQRKEKIREVNEGITILIRDIQASKSLTDVYMILNTLVENVNTKGLWTYGLLNDKGQIQSSTALETIKGIIKNYNDTAAQTSFTMAEQLQLAISEYETHNKKLFSRSSAQSKTAVEYLKARLIYAYDIELRSDVAFLLGLSRNFHFKKAGLDPLVKGSKLYTLLYSAYIKSPPIR